MASIRESARITPELASKLRSMALPLVDGKTAYMKIAEQIKHEFPMFAIHTIRDYSTITTKVSDRVFNLYTDGKISWTVLTELGQSSLDRATVDFIATELLERNMGLSELKKLKSILKEGKLSIAEALDVATGKGEQIKRNKEVGKINKSFEEVFDDFIKLCFKTRATAQLLVDLIPLSVFENGKVKTELFNKAWMARHAFKEQFEWCDKRVQEMLEQIMKFVSSEAQLNEIRKEEGNGGSGSAEEGGHPVSEAGQVLQDAPGNAPGEGRIEAQDHPGA